MTSQQIDDELMAWSMLQRQLFHIGRLSPAKIASLEAIKGWSWELVRENGVPPRIPEGMKRTS